MAFFGLFGPKSPVESHEWEWILASLKWLEEEFPRDDGGLGASALILPTAATFPPLEGRSAEKAEQLFTQIKVLADLEDWPTLLKAQSGGSRPPPIDPVLLAERRWHNTLGTFSLQQDTQGEVVAQITYDPSQLDDPSSFVATMAHELAHYLISTAKRCPPGGWDVHELITDLTAVWMGFGIFLANNAKSFEAFTDHDRQGWQMQNRGYLNERALITTLALTAASRSEDALAAIPYLKPHLATDLKSASKYISQFDIAKEIATIDLHDFRVELIG